MINAIEFFTLRWLILPCVNFTCVIFLINQQKYLPYGYEFHRKNMPHKVFNWSNFAMFGFSEEKEISMALKVAKATLLCRSFSNPDA